MEQADAGMGEDKAGWVLVVLSQLAGMMQGFEGSRWVCSTAFGVGEVHPGEFESGRPFLMVHQGNSQAKMGVCVFGIARSERQTALYGKDIQFFCLADRLLEDVLVDRIRVVSANGCAPN
jgi:hypothetical protein